LQMPEIPNDENLLSALANLRSEHIFGVKNLRQVMRGFLNPALVECHELFDSSKLST
jgi:hypothetical protein